MSDFKQDVYYTLKSKNSGLYLDNQGVSNDGTIVTTYHYTGIDHQLWMIVPINDGNSILCSKNSGLILDNQGVSKDGTKVTTYHYTGIDHQFWYISPVGGEDGYYTLRSMNSGLYLDNQGVSKDGTPVTTYHRTDNNDHQLWAIEESDSKVKIPSMPTATFPPAPKFIDDHTLEPTPSPVITNTALVPYFVVDDSFESSAKDKITNNPYYLFTKTESWKQQAQLNNISSGDERTYQVSSGISSTDQSSMTKTTSMSIGEDLGFSFGPLSESISVSFSEELQVSESHSSTQSTEETYTLTHVNSKKYTESWALFYVQEDYKLLRSDGSLVADPWSLLNSTKSGEAVWPEEL
ncbi:RICIN domain-containing protein [Brevibacillus brevis]|uniref:RICIN domain-containing protein n=1 Tax=Brevibacillus brevis TaxID=1393 RepID=UPI0025A55BAB|nr:RICIN domain-containing protein [Brevibacillus brevis]WJQ84373.1 RICIN domain-containing protein [Brevibacillus brevis]